MPFDPLDPPDPITIVRWLFLGALVVAGIAAVTVVAQTGDIPWRLLSLIGFLWTVWALADRIHESALAPLARFLHRQFIGGEITLEDEIADLEARLARPDLPRSREILATIRLAEIYCERLYDKPRADALLDRMMAKYPDSTELRIARRLPL